MADSVGLSFEWAAHDHQLHQMGGKPRKKFLIAGVDEVGRGPLAGPVIACATLIDLYDFDEALLQGVADSKSLSAAKRAALVLRLQDKLDHAFGAASVREIDQINILQASKLAMVRALAHLSHHIAQKQGGQKQGGQKQNAAKGAAIDFLLIDGNQPLAIDLAQQTLIKGDSKAFTIAAASIFAKTRRDDLMKRLDAIHPHYDFKSNAGYGVKKHLEAIQKHGITPHHRTSFAPIRNYLAHFE